MIHLACKLPRKVVVACSGGPDSMAALDFLRRPGKVKKVIHVNHLTDFSDAGAELVRWYCGKYNLRYQLLAIDALAKTEFDWSEARHELFRKHSENHKIVTGHTLDDAVEWWIYTAAQGNPKLMPVKSHRSIKPFIKTRKARLIQWCEDNDVPYLIDPTNADGSSNMRSKMRKNVIPGLLDVYPGLYSSIRSKYD